MRKTRYAHSHPTLPVIAKRFRRSPFLDCYVTDETVFGVYSGRMFAMTIGDDPIANYWALRREVRLFDVPEHPIEIAGPDAQRLLDKVMTRNIAKLRIGRAQYALACYHDGGIVMDGVLMRRAEQCYWYVLADGEFLGWLRAHASGLDVTIRDPDSSVLQVQGPKALAVLADACDGGAPADFRYFDIADCVMGGQPVLVSRTGWTNEMGFELYTPGPTTDAPALWRHLMQAGAPHGMAYSSQEAMGIRRIEGGILDNGTDMDASMTPYQAGLGAFVDLSKPDFIGKAALEAADRRPLLHGLECRTATPVTGMVVKHGDSAVGRVQTGAWSPYLDRGIGYVRFNEAGDWPGRRVTIDVDGAGHEATVVELPFYDVEKRIPRGLDHDFVPS